VVPEPSTGILVLGPGVLAIWLRWQSKTARKERRPDLNKYGPAIESERFPYLAD
jgi:hypothetical protein